MSFLQPLILFGLPLIALPIIIHLIHQRRFQTVKWAAMAFLLAATRMSKGYARLRQWLILAARTVAIAGLIFAVSRPLSSGWLGMAAGGRVDTTIILLDRSASMSQVGIGGQTKLSAGIKRLYESLGKLDSAHYILIESVGMRIIELDSVDQLNDLAEYNGASATADIPAMLELVEDYLRNQQPSRTEVWICSDHRITDWNPESGRWKSLRDALASRARTVRFHSLAFENQASDNAVLIGKGVRRTDGDEAAELLISFDVQVETSGEAKSIPLQLELNGVVKEIEIDLTGGFAKISDYSVPIDPKIFSGWGRLSLPADANDQDNHFYFTYQKEPIRRTLIVTDDATAIRPLQFASSIAADASIEAQANISSPTDVVSSAVDEYSMVLWHSDMPSPTDPARLWLQAHRDRGGSIMFFPSPLMAASSRQFASIRWGGWIQEDNQVTSWESEKDLLSNTQNGDSLPVGDLRVQRYAQLEGDYITLATLSQGATILAKSIDTGSPVYFCTTTVNPLDSNLASSGVVLFAMIQRAIEQGVKSQGVCRLTEAGAIEFDRRWSDNSNGRGDNWIKVAGNPGVLSTEQPSHAGIYRSGDRWVAVNRPLAEDDSRLVSDEKLASLFGDLSFRTVRDEVGAERSLIQEVWRLFLLVMLVMLLAESVLSLPRRSVPQAAVMNAGLSGTGFTRTGSAG